MLLPNHVVVQAPRLIRWANRYKAFQRREANVSNRFTVMVDLVNLLLTVQVPDLCDSFIIACLFECKHGNLITFWRKFSYSHSLVNWNRFWKSTIAIKNFDLIGRSGRQNCSRRCRGNIQSVYSDTLICGTYIESPVERLSERTDVSPLRVVLRRLQLLSLLD